jgi:hypothetical protein
VGPYSASEYEDAKVEIFKLMQRGEDFKDIRYQKLNPELDCKDGLYKSHSRLKSQYLPEKVQRPVILPKDNLFAA